ncbi:MAG: T9SS type A sorting domain-containing protein [Candidatus Marinimicrobia bacterium]|nr:T9SS type A sorting domain-containing protein [Candidatus Neomarinimicrobiota bacterium]MCF7850378.1 T9SS type A sorting domain-containing protein [Candidatus Neomarinimicrobiota bacterium]MCF7904980.1 T9SS type A sorting domain-containing protein [Candidatus Neomarinimicrobiota bacterium]
MKSLLKGLIAFFVFLCAVYPQHISKVSAGTSHFYIEHLPAVTEYSLSFDVRGDSISAVSVEGPNISLTQLEFEQTFTGSEWRWHKDVELVVKPVAGDTYIFHITFNNLSSKDTSDTITGTIEEFPTIIFPQHEGIINTTTPTFTWTQLAMEVGGMDLIVMDLTPEEEQNVWYSGLTRMDTSIVYNFDSSGVALESSKTYGWVLVYRDESEENSATLFSSFLVDLTTSLSNRQEAYNLILLQNNPNPLNPTTTISYELPELSNVILTVYDVLGREVRTLQNQEQPAGRYEVLWNGVDDSGNQMSTGVYFARLQAGATAATAFDGVHGGVHYSKTIKMVLLR